MDDHRRRWLRTASVVQAGLAAPAALALAAGVLGPTGTARLWVIALLGAGSGVQNATVRRLAIPDLTTSVLTMTTTGMTITGMTITGMTTTGMTITGIAADTTLGGGDHPRQNP